MSLTAPSTKRSRTPGVPRPRTGVRPPTKQPAPHRRVPCYAIAPSSQVAEAYRAACTDPEQFEADYQEALRLRSIYGRTLDGLVAQMDRIRQMLPDSRRHTS